MALQAFAMATMVAQAMQHSDCRTHSKGGRRGSRGGGAGGMDKRDRSIIMSSALIARCGRKNSYNLASWSRISNEEERRAGPARRCQYRAPRISVVVHGVGWWLGRGIRQSYPSSFRFGMECVKRRRRHSATAFLAPANDSGSEGRRPMRIPRGANRGSNMQRTLAGVAARWLAGLLRAAAVAVAGA